MKNINIRFFGQFDTAMHDKAHGMAKRLISNLERDSAVRRIGDITITGKRSGDSVFVKVWADGEIGL